MLTQRIFLTLTGLLVLCNTSYADRSRYRPSVRYESQTLEASTLPTREDPNLTLTIQADGTAQLTLELIVPFGVPAIEIKYDGRFDRRRLLAVFNDSESSTSFRLRLKDNGRSGLSISNYDKYTFYENSSQIERHRFDNYGRVLYSLYSSKSNISGDIDTSYNSSSHTYKSTASGNRVPVKSISVSKHLVTHSEVDRSSRSHTYYLYDKQERAAGTIGVSYGTNEFSEEPIASLSYSVDDNDVLSRTSATTSETGKNAARFFRYADYLARRGNPEELNFLMSHVREIYFENESGMLYGLPMKTIVEYRVESDGLKAKLIPLGGRIDYDKIFIARGEVDALEPENITQEDIVISWPYPYYYTNEMHKAGINARNIAMYYDHERGDFGFGIIGESQLVFVSASVFAHGDENGRASATVEVDGQTIHFSLRDDGFLEFVLK